jgi:hypothetical protein
VTFPLDPETYFVDPAARVEAVEAA